MRFFHLLVLFFLATASAVSDAQTEFTGTAYDLKTGEFVYTEQHSLNKEETELVTQYTNSEGKSIANRVVQFSDGRVARYELSQGPLNYRESIVRQGTSGLFEQTKGDKSKSKTIENANIKEVVIDAGFSNFIKRNWDQLLSGNTLKFDFASIDQFNFVRLQLRYKKTITKSEQEVALFSMTAANPVFKMFMKPIKIGYYQQTQQLALYQGVSNLQRDDGRYYKVRIEFPFE